jgi:lysophospholipase L1-like esterase
MPIVKFRKGQWSVLKSKRLPNIMSSVANTLSTPAVSSDGRTYSGTGVKPLSTVIVYANGSLAGTTVADSSGNWSYAFSTVPTAGAVIGYDGVSAAPTLVAPSVPLNLQTLDLNARFVAEGDSITAGSNGPMWPLAFVLRTRGRFIMPQLYNQATGGQTAAQMATQVSQITAQNPKLVSLLAGTNDLTGSADTPAQIYANLKTCWKGYIDGGAKHVIAIKVLPRNDAAFLALSAGRQADRVALNNLIGGFANDSDLALYAAKIHVVDLESTFIPATDTIEGLHPHWLGANKIGFAVGDVANTLMQQNFLLNDLYLDSSNLLLAAKNPALTGTAGTLGTATGQLADGWTHAENGGMTVVASKTTMNGAAAQRFVVSGTNSTANRIVNFSAPVTISGAIGDAFEAAIDFSLAAGSQNVRDIVVNHSTGATPNEGNQSFVMNGQGAMSGTLRTRCTGPLAATATTLTLQAMLVFDAGTVAADVTWGKPYLRKIPAGL